MRRCILIACLTLLGWPTSARAEEPTAPPRFYVRLGAALITPITSSDELVLSEVDGPASLAVQNGPVAGSGATVDSAAAPAGVLGYVLPTASRRWSLQLLIGLPFTAKFKATGTLATMSIAPTALGIPTGVGPLGADMGEAKGAPFVVTGVYQLLADGMFRPYVGGGGSVLFAYDAHVTNPVLTAVGKPEMSIAPAPGVVLQTGLDVRIWKSVYAQLDVKFIALMKARAEVRHIQVKTPGLPLFDSVEVGTAKMSMWLNPLVVQGGVGIDF